jgi:hypothetical protein
MERGILRQRSPGRRLESSIKKKTKIEKLQKVQEGTAHKEGFQNLNFVGIPVQHNMALHHGKVI